MQCRAAAAAAITRNLSHFVRAILPDCGVLKVLRSMPEGVRLQNSITQSVRRKDRVDYYLGVAQIE